MIDKELLDLSRKLKSTIDRQKEMAISSLDGLQEGDTKKGLSQLLQRAVNGKLNYEEAQKEVEKIIRNASKS